jgi:hypothetical protein
MVNLGITSLDCIYVDNHNLMNYKLRNITLINFVVDNYNFTNYNFENTELTDEIVMRIHKPNKLKLSKCKRITNESVKLLGCCHTLILYFCNQITDERLALGRQS